MSANRRKSARLQALPGDLADHALVAIDAICDAADMSKSWVREEVRAGRFQEPVIREPRCTRWRLADVRTWLIARAKAAADPQRGAAVVERAKKASEAARAKRTAAVQAEGSDSMHQHRAVRSPASTDGKRQ
jgi:prophage regulatory protein